MSELTVTRNDDDHRYEGRAGDALAIIAFRLREDGGRTVVDMVHTEVPDAMQGQGVGGQLVRGALDDVRQRGEVVQPSCPFVASWIREHPDYADLVAQPS